MGSKNRYAKELLPIILKDRKFNQWYVEPFCGGCNMIDKVNGNNRIANDIQFYLIEMFKALQNNWQPPDFVSEEMWYDVKKNKEEYLPALVGFIGFGCSFSGKWFGGYARGNQNNGNPRNYCMESKKNVLNQVNKLKEVQFFNVNYWELKIPDNSIIYCDPPYANTEKYKDGFDTDKFWNWCEQKVKENHIVFVSEYSAPLNWKCIWSKIVYNTLDLNTGAKQGTEKLFQYIK
jgi:DNA adenine methylase